MSYTRNLLSRGEEVVFETRQHWLAVFAQVWLYALLAVIALAVVIWQTSVDDWALRGLLQVIGIVVLLGSLVRIGLVIWAWQNQEYMVTTRRVIKAEGIFNKTMGDSSLEKVNDAHLTQSWLGRIFGYGHLDIMTAADEPGAVEDFPMMADAVEFKIAMMNQKELIEHPELARPAAQRPSAPPPMQRADPMPPRAGSDRVHVSPSYEAAPAGQPPAQPPAALPAAAPSAGGSQELASTLERLADLRDRGLITPEEYEAKKRDILERM
jgi:membrane protein YdbS with pleckstrin-like domain